MASEDIVSENLKEILPFLDVLTPDDYKGQILEFILGMTGTSDGVASIVKSKKLLDALADLTCHDKSDKIRLECLRILVNLSSTSSDVMKHLVDPDFIYFLLNAVVHKDLDCCDLVAMLLSNLTQNSDNCQKVVSNLQKHDRVTLSTLVDAFSTPGYNKQCQLHHLGTCLSNMSPQKDIRLLFLKKEDNLIGRILPYTQYQESSVRRFAAASMIKNCLFETNYHEWLLFEAEILPHLLLPLAGPEEFTDKENEELLLDLQYLPPDKKRESNKEIQILLMESLFQLCATKKCRMHMKSCGVYYIIRELHKTFEENDIAEIALENLIQILIGDEPEIEGGDNLREIEIPADIEKKLK